MAYSLEVSRMYVATKIGKRLRGMMNLALKPQKLPHLGHFSKEILDLVAP
jgi:hypothetical protein